MYSSLARKAQPVASRLMEPTCWKADLWRSSHATETSRNSNLRRKLTSVPHLGRGLARRLRRCDVGTPLEVVLVSPGMTEMEGSRLRGMEEVPLRAEARQTLNQANWQEAMQTLQSNPRTEVLISPKARAGVEVPAVGSVAVAAISGRKRAAAEVAVGGGEVAAGEERGRAAAAVGSAAEVEKVVVPKGAVAAASEAAARVVLGDAVAAERRTVAAAASVAGAESKAAASR